MEVEEDTQSDQKLLVAKACHVMVYKQHSKEQRLEKVASISEKTSFFFRIFCSKRDFLFSSRKRLHSTRARIRMISSLVVKLSGVLELEEARKLLKDCLRKTYAAKGEELIQRNIKG